MVTDRELGASCDHKCLAPARFGGMSAARKYSNADLGVMWRCNRRVPKEGDRCWQHPTDTDPDTSDAGAA